MEESKGPGKVGRTVNYIAVAILLSGFLCAALYLLVMYVLQRSYNPYFVENNYTIHYLPFILLLLLGLLLKALWEIKRDRHTPYISASLIVVALSVLMYFPVRSVDKTYYVGEVKHEVPSVYMPRDTYSNRQKSGFLIKVVGAQFKPAYRRGAGSSPDSISKIHGDIWEEAIPNEAFRENFRMESKYFNEGYLFSDAVPLSHEEVADSLRPKFEPSLSEKYSISYPVREVNGFVLVMDIKSRTIVSCSQGFNLCSFLYQDKENNVVYKLSIGPLHHSDIDGYIKRRDDVIALMDSFVDKGWFF